MHDCVIMHNMIIKNECAQDLDYSQYEFLEHLVRMRHRTTRVAQFIASYHVIRRADLIKEWWEWNGRHNE